MDGSKIVAVVVVLMTFLPSFRFAIAKHSYWLKVSFIVIVVVRICMAYAACGHFVQFQLWA